MKMIEKTSLLQTLQMLQYNCSQEKQVPPQHKCCGFFAWIHVKKSWHDIKIENNDTNGF